MKRKVLFYPTMAAGSKLDHYAEDYTPITAELDRLKIPHTIVNCRGHKIQQFEKIYNKHKPTDVFFRLPGCENSAILYFKKKKCKTHCILHGWPTKSHGHLPVNTDKFYIWGDLNMEFFLQHKVKAKLVITGSPRFDGLYHQSKKKKFNHIPVIGFASVPWHHWISKDGAYQRYEYAKVVYSLSTIGFPVIKQRFHPIEQNEGFYKKYMELGKGRVQFSSPYDMKFADWLMGIDIMVTTQSGGVIEAAMLGIPTVCMSFFGKPDYVPSNKYGLSTKVTSKQLLQDAIIEAYNNVGNINPAVYKFNKYFDGQSAKRIVESMVC